MAVAVAQVLVRTSVLAASCHVRLFCRHARAIPTPEQRAYPRRASPHTSTGRVLAVEDWDYNFLPLGPGGIPDDVFASDRTLRLNGSTLELKHYGPAHTDGDISVHFAEADILHVADTFWNGIYPFVDYSTGGSIEE